MVKKQERCLQRRRRQHTPLARYWCIRIKVLACILCQAHQAVGTLPPPFHVPPAFLPRRLPAPLSASISYFLPASPHTPNTRTPRPTPLRQLLSFYPTHRRVCQSLNYVMGGMFLIGLCSQKFLGPLSKDCGSCIVPDPDKESGLFTPPRYRFPSKRRLTRRPAAHTATRKDTCSSSSDFELEDDGEPESADEQRPGLGGGRRDGGGQKAGGEEESEDQQRQYCDQDSREFDEGDAFILGEAGKRAGRGGVWERASAGTKR